MSRTLTITLLFVAALSASVVGQTKGARAERNRRVEEEIKKIERQWLIEPYFTADMTAYDRIVADDFTITHSNGAVLDKAQKRANILADHITDPASPFRIGESAVRVYGSAAVSVGYIVEAKSTVRFTNTYVKRGGRWQVVASQLNRVRQQ